MSPVALHITHMHPPYFSPVFYDNIHKGMFICPWKVVKALIKKWCYPHSRFSLNVSSWTSLPINWETPGRPSCCLSHALTVPYFIQPCTLGEPLVFPFSTWQSECDFWMVTSCLEPPQAPFLTLKTTPRVHDGRQRPRSVSHSLISLFYLQALSVLLALSQAHWPPCCSSNLSLRILSQGLCTSYNLSCYLHDSLNFLQYLLLI